MTADHDNMTPILQHSFCLARVSYVGPAHAERHVAPSSPRPVDQAGPLDPTELDRPASRNRRVAFPDAA
jgi:hypothetical protein